MSVSKPVPVSTRSGLALNEIDVTTLRPDSLTAYHDLADALNDMATKARDGRFKNPWGTYGNLGEIAQAYETLATALGPQHKLFVPLLDSASITRQPILNATINPRDFFRFPPQHIAEHLAALALEANYQLIILNDVTRSSELKIKQKDIINGLWAADIEARDAILSKRMTERLAGEYGPDETGFKALQRYYKPLPYNVYFFLATNHKIFVNEIYGEPTNFFATPNHPYGRKLDRSTLKQQRTTRSRFTPPLGILASYRAEDLEATKEEMIKKGDFEDTCDVARILATHWRHAAFVPSVKLVNGQAQGLAIKARLVGNYQNGNPEMAAALKKWFTKKSEKLSSSDNKTTPDPGFYLLYDKYQNGNPEMAAALAKWRAKKAAAAPKI